MRSRELPSIDAQEIYDNFQGEMVADDVPGSRIVPVRGLITDITHFRSELRLPHIQYLVREQLENGKVVAAKNKGTEIVLYIANNKSTIAAGGAVLAGVGALYLLGKRAVHPNTQASHLIFS